MAIELPIDGVAWTIRGCDEACGPDLSERVIWLPRQTAEVLTKMVGRAASLQRQAEHKQVE
jgi:hypothetical protein